MSLKPHKRRKANINRPLRATSENRSELIYSSLFLRVAPKDAGALGAWASRTPVNIIYRSGLRPKGDAHHKIRLYVDIRARLRTAALEIVEHRLALRFELRCVEQVFDLSLESITFNCSYDDQHTIGGRTAAGPGYPGRVDKDTPLRSGLLHPHFAWDTSFLGVVPDPPPLKWSDLRYVFDIQEDCNGKEAIQARRDCREAAAGRCSGLAGPEYAGRNPPDRGERGDVLSVAPGVRRAEVRGAETP